MRRVAPFIVWGAVSFWALRIALIVARRGAPDVISWTAVLPSSFATGYVLALVVPRRPGTNPSAAVYMAAGAWLFGGLATLTAATLRGAGIYNLSLLDTVATVALSMLPPYTAIMATYDGTLAALLLTLPLATFSHLAFERDRWVVPPQVKRWFDDRA